MVCRVSHSGIPATLIRHASAQRYHLKGRKVTVEMIVVGNEAKTIETYEYHVPLSDANGNIWIVRAFGMDEITAYMRPVDVSQADGLFHNITLGDIQRPSGVVDLLVGADCSKLMPL